MNAAFDKIPFWKQFFCDEDGTGSMTRLLTWLFALSALLCVWAEVRHTHAIPDPSRLMGLASFVLSPIGANYVHNATVVKFTQPQGPDK